MLVIVGKDANTLHDYYIYIYIVWIVLAIFRRAYPKYILLQRQGICSFQVYHSRYGDMTDAVRFIRCWQRASESPENQPTVGRIEPAQSANARRRSAKSSAFGYESPK